MIFYSKEKSFSNRGTLTHVSFPHTFRTGQYLHSVQYFLFSSGTSSTMHALGLKLKKKKQELIQLSVMHHQFCFMDAATYIFLLRILYDFNVSIVLSGVKLVINLMTKQMKLTCKCIMNYELGKLPYIPLTLCDFNLPPRDPTLTANCYQEC